VSEVVRVRDGFARIPATLWGLMVCGLIGLSLPGCGEPLPDRSAPATSEMPTDLDATTEHAPETHEADQTGPPDADGDGVVDLADACPDTQRGMAVDAAGCPIDADGDGVVAANDLCPNSPYGEPVDDTGCKPRLTVAQEYTLSLSFETGSATIIGDPHAALAEAAALMTQYPETTVVIEGHTDSRGAAKYNQKISAARARAVAEVLIDDLGIDSTRVSTKGLGQTRPIATNATKKGRERNRRVIAIVMPGPAPTAPTETSATASWSGG
jgi:outer membrane protein OmpA-like peptidoglycan-associated protein